MSTSALTPATSVDDRLADELALDVALQAIERLASDIEARSARAAEESARRGDEIDAMLARIRDVMAGRDVA